MAKTICDWSRKDLAKHPKRLQALTRDACFFCRKCGRVANTKKALCKAEGFPQRSKIEKVDFAA